jgi:SAM-dependent methyltransferase
MERHTHWEQLWTSRGGSDVSWHEPTPAVSLRLMEAAGLSPESCVVDVGGGDSRLVDALVERGLRCVTVLDISRAALVRAQERLGNAGRLVTWIATDVTASWRIDPVDIWHDRAVFHFLVDSDDRRRYLNHLRETLKPSGTAIIATFAPEGPERCSGLPVVRYAPETLAEELGPEYQLVESLRHDHLTPTGVSLLYQYSRFVRRAHESA